MSEFTYLDAVLKAVKLAKNNTSQLAKLFHASRHPSYSLLPPHKYSG